MMLTKKYFFFSTVILFLLWLAIIFGVALLQTNGNTELTQLVRQSIGLAFVLAPTALFIFAIYFRKDYTFGLQLPVVFSALKIIAFPLVIISIILFFTFASKSFNYTEISFILVNTLLVGISEELMFRGILFESFSQRFSFWKTIIFTSILFGAVHSLNGFITGNFLASTGQSIQAMMFGVWLMSIRIRTKSIYPAMLIHGLWDFAIFTLSISHKTNIKFETSALAVISFPVAIELPFFIYGLWLLRKVNKANSKGEKLEELS